VADLASLDERDAQAALGAANGAHLRLLAMGVDDRDVVPHQMAKSIGHEETFAHDHHSLDTLQRQVTPVPMWSARPRSCCTRSIPRPASGSSGCT
jgi:nucleotidyltransferase/DNA polymerase involved in DNA repair